MSTPCRCGSGLQRRALYDGWNIFLAYVCDGCEQARLREFRPDILQRYVADEPIEDEYEDRHSRP